MVPCRLTERIVNVNTVHATERIAERLTFTESVHLASAIVNMAQNMPDNRAYAVMVHRVKESRGTFAIEPDGTGPSNGTDLYAIVRNRTLVTVMWRRTAQPVSPDAFRVDIVGKATLVR